MTPSLESVIFSSATVSLNVNMLSKGLAHKDCLFNNSTLNGCVIFKFPNFDPAMKSLSTLPGVDLVAGNKQSGRMAVRTGIFAPKSSEEMKIGGYGIFLDEPDLNELLKRFIGIDLEKEECQDDLKLLGILRRLPSLDPFILRESLLSYKIKAHSNYIDITDEECADVRHVIADKVEPIVAKALGAKPGRKIDISKAQKFIDAIWDPSLDEAKTFVAALGIQPDEAPRIFDSWKGISYYYYEFQSKKTDVARFIDWLKGSDSRPTDYIHLAKGTKEQIDMFRKKTLDKTLRVSENVRDIFTIYDESYRYFIEEDNPKKFREFLENASQLYWKVGACNGVLAQMSTTWNRYTQQSLEADRRLAYDETHRLYQVCGAILDAYDRDGSGAF